MKDNKLRGILREGRPSVATRLWSAWAFYMEALAATGNFDYAEFVAEYSPHTQADLENLARAAELHGMGTMIKIDLQNRGYVAQKAVAAGFQAVLFADHKTPDEVRESIRLIKPDTPELGGRYGCPSRRFIGTQCYLSQMDHAKRLDEIVLCFMIEKVEAMRHIDEICAIPGVDMVQFGPADYSMNSGYNAADHTAETKAAERKMIETALKHGVQPRCEIQTPLQAQYYIDLGVRHFCLGDQFHVLHSFWTKDGKKMRDIAEGLG